MRKPAILQLLFRDNESVSVLSTAVRDKRKARAGSFRLEYRGNMVKKHQAILVEKK